MEYENQPLEPMQRQLLKILSKKDLPPMSHKNKLSKKPILPHAKFP